jgi:short-subunit dehydrogenase
MKETVVITGLADGMGREVAKMLAAGGDSIAGFDLDAGKLDSLRKELSAIGGDHLLEPLNISDRPGIRKFRDKVLKKYGAVDTVLSNVGIGFFGPFEEVDLEKALSCLDINVIGTAAVFQAFLPGMREKRRGKLIAMSSLVGQVPFPFESIYSASKFAVEGMVLSLKIEVEPFGIKCAIIQPAQVSTSFAAKIHVLPPEKSPYRERVRRFIARDDDLIKTAPDPSGAAKKICRVMKSANPKTFNQVDFSSTFLLALNRVLPGSIRNEILVRYMDIKE